MISSHRFFCDLPEVLVVDLDIFDWDGQKLGEAGGSQFLPDDLDLAAGFEEYSSKICDWGWKFELFAFVACRGPSLNDCMYEAVVKKQG